MIVTKYFVYIHVSRTAGTFLNKLILENVPGARMLQYHGHLEDLPGRFSHLPVIGLVRNPWDWYVSMYFDYRRKQQYVYEIISEHDKLGFKETIARFLQLGDNSDLSKRLLNRVIQTAPKDIDSETPPRLGNPGLLAGHFSSMTENEGYYSWLCKIMFRSKTAHRVHIGRFENLREETFRLLSITGTPITKRITSYLGESSALNSSPRPDDYVGAYPPELEQLVADKEKYLVDMFDYELSEPQKYPKTNFFRHLGTADTGALLNRLKETPESLWELENQHKPNKFARLNDARHIIFRYVNSSTEVYDYHDLPLWEAWKDLLLPIMEQAAKSLGYENYRFPRAMLARLPAGSEISRHSDGNASHYIHKIHVPLITNPQSIFHVGSEQMQIPAGEIFEVNNKRTHSVRNEGGEDRIHFIFECYNMQDYNKPA